MRVVFRFLAVAGLALGMATPGWSQGAAPAASPEGPGDRQIVITEGADYFGSDYDVRRDVDLARCSAECIGDPECRAFTYNNSSRWCFLKNGLGELRSVAGAVSGRIVAAAEPKVDLTAERVAELAFLPQTAVDEARRLEGRITSAGARSRSLGEAIAAAESASAAGNPAEALAAYRAALALAPQRFDLWIGFTRMALATQSDDWRVREELGTDRVSGAVAAYLRAIDPSERSLALDLMARGLADRDDWKPAIRAWRAALALAEDPAMRRTYDAALREHGFRVTDHTVEADASAPRICLVFSDDLATGRGDLSEFVAVEGPGTVSVEARGQQICIDGVQHGSRYRVTARPGLPAADGEALASRVDLDVYVRDRAASARFPGTAYVLPAGGDPTVPIVTVNADRVEAKLYRLGERQLAGLVGTGNFLAQLSGWQTGEIADRTGELVWEGSVEVASELNREVTTAIPVGELDAGLGAGLYVLSAEPAGAAEDWGARATQWFVVSDLGLTTLSGNDGLHVFVRSLGTAAAAEGVTLRLVAVNNDILGTATTDSDGYARFAPGLVRGTGGMAPGILTAEGPDGDFDFLDMQRPAMDLADRGVEGRAPPQPLDVYLTTERGIYRVGETVHATALVRDAEARAVPGVPLTVLVTRPDGKEHQRFRLEDEGAGGASLAIDLPANAMRGSWRIAVHADPEKPALAETSVLVEDFQAERLTFDLVTDGEALDPANPSNATLEARFLYGTPAAGLDVEGELVVKPVRELAAYPGYVFGLADDPAEARTEPFSGISTDEAGAAAIPLDLSGLPVTSRPLEAAVNVRVLDPGGRPVERSVSLPVRTGEPRIGIRPLFAGEVPENSNVAFSLVAIGPDGEPIEAGALAWSLYKVETNYQWYRRDGSWDYETVDSRTRVAGGEIQVAADAPARIEAPVEWGSYEIEVASAGDALLPASLAFEAGWYVEPGAAETPEALKVSLDKPRYRIGETAEVHLETRFPGIALVAVIDDRLVSMHAVEVSGSSADLSLPVTRDWGPGAYVTAFLYRPMDVEAKRMPARAVGLSWASVDPAERRLETSIVAPDESEPRRNVGIEVAIAGLDPGTDAYVTLAAVDLGILNLTRYEAPDPAAYYFGQRRLGMAIRDVYGQLIDRMQGARGIVRSGGDASAASYDGPPPPETLVAWHSGVVKVDAEGRAILSVPIPDFSGTVRLMAMAWTAEGVGRAVKDMLVRDPVVIATSLPRFLAPGDRTRLALDLTSIAIDGEATLSVAAASDNVIVGGDAGTAIALVPGERRQVLVPVTAGAVGEGGLDIALTLPDGSVLEKHLPVDIRRNDPPVAVTSFLTVAPGAGVTVGTDVIADLLPETASIDVSASAAGRLDIPAILRALDRYPYGCTEQTASRALPLLYLNEVASAAGLGDDPQLRKRVQDAIVAVLANQAPSGSFGLWGPGSDDLWLDSFVSDFLVRARAAGYDVPETGYALALDNLKNRLAYAPDFTSGGEDVAYALYVLAKTGRASIGDLRYYAETKLSAFATPLAKAQIGAALALYGDRVRAGNAFSAALADLASTADDTGWRSDYGTPLRDGAAVLTLAAETRSLDDLEPLARRVEAGRALKAHTSTQEDAWSLLAANALIRAGDALDLAVGGMPVTGSFARRFDADALAAAPLGLENRGAAPVDVAVTITGVPAEPLPAGGSFYAIERAYYTLDGEVADPALVEQGSRLVTVLTIRSTEPFAAHLIVDDPLPAGFEIDNPHLLAGGDVAALDWLQTVDAPAHLEFRADRFVAALDRGGSDPTEFRLAYVVRAVSPGTFAHPAALVADMYRPERRARTETGRVEVVGPLR